MNTAFDGMGELIVSFGTDGPVKAGQAVCVGAGGTVSVAPDGERFAGIVTGSRGGLAGVLLRGFVRAKYVGTAPETGYTALSAAGGYVAADDAGTEYLVVEVDAKNKTVGFFM